MRHTVWRRLLPGAAMVVGSLLFVSTFDCSHYRLPPGETLQRGTDQDSETTSINSLGFRGSEVRLTEEANVAEAPGHVIEPDLEAYLCRAQRGTAEGGKGRERRGSASNRTAHAAETTPPQGRGNVFRRLWHGWKRFGKNVADFQSRLLLTIFYFVVIAPFALGIRWGADPLAVKPATPKGWRLRPQEPSVTIERARQQF